LKNNGYIFTKLSALGAFWDKDERFNFGGQKVNVQGHAGSNMLENALFGLVSTIS